MHWSERLARGMEQAYSLTGDLAVATLGQGLAFMAAPRAPFLQRQALNQFIQRGLLRPLFPQRPSAFPPMQFPSQTVPQFPPQTVPQFPTILPPGQGFLSRRRQRGGAEPEDLGFGIPIGIGANDSAIPLIGGRIGIGQIADFLGFGKTRIAASRQDINRRLEDSFGDALLFRFKGVKRELRERPDLAALRPMLLNAAKQTVRGTGNAKRLVNQFLANASFYNLTPRDTIARFNQLGR
jgi:hypothetical protein